MTAKVNVNLKGYETIKKNDKISDNKILEHLFKNEDKLGGVSDNNLTANELRKFFTHNVQGKENSTDDNIFVTEQEFKDWKLRNIEAGNTAHIDFTYEEMQELAKVVNLGSNTDKMSSGTDKVTTNLKAGDDIVENNSVAKFLTEQVYKKDVVSPEETTKWIKDSFVEGGYFDGMSYQEYTNTAITRDQFENWKSSESSWFNFGKDDGYKQAVKNLSYDDFKGLMKHFQNEDAAVGTMAHFRKLDAET